MTEPAVAAEGIVKRFAGVTALDGVDFAVAPGEVRGLLGKNGAGKSTLIKILSGVQRPDEGAVSAAGERLDLRAPSDALAAGIVTVYQELSVVPELTVAENVFLGRLPRMWPYGPVDWRRAYADAERALAIFDQRIDVHERAGRLSLADQQIVEIARALSQDARVLILDEPTSSLASHEVDVLLAAVRRVAQQGIAVIYISHRLGEIARVADAVTVLRDGRLVGTVGAQTPTSEVVSMIFGDVEPPARGQRSHLPRNDAPPVLQLRNVTPLTKLRDVNLTVRPHEILGIAGLQGSGRTELLRAIAGLDPIRGGEITIERRTFRRPSVQRMLAAGVALAPEDRRREGIVPLLGVDENLVNSHWENVSRFRAIRPREMAARAEDLIRRLGVATARRDTPVGTLSGGNQQKVVIGKWLDPRTKVLLLDEPTRGIDLHAKEQIFQLVRELADAGLGVVFVSSEFEELTAVCNTIVVLRAGMVRERLDATTTTPEGLLGLSSREEAA